MTATSRQRIQRAGYCLYCYTTLESTSGPSQRCPSCGRVHVRVNQAVFWTLEPRLRWIEAMVKAGIVLFLVGVLLALAMKVDMGTHPVNTFFIGPLVFLGFVLWWTAGLITRKPRHFSPRLLWVTVLGLLVVGPPILLFVLDVAARRESFGPAYWNSMLLLTSPAIPMFCIALALHFFAGRFEAFKKRRIESGGLWR